ncbi:MAG: sterol-binding protein [Gammaproteobacteria bacterium]|nr:sterol-binding protein [Gammaproteobacteria bacterium]NIR81832.1 sterol-binding protein [Gammaproteobacteria bacterium]NIR88664.1 sterol-binding protein [Gammaproteobacteria bacterium]NIU02940.1 sterol-binding protein [Gammaproteobacteria bacterium]NIV50461.1 sterol-binding protein [Gammaproteobacteria bacterium]
MSTPGLALLVLESVFNRVLRLDPEAPQRLAPLAGVVLAVRFVGLDLPLHLRFDADGVAFLREAPERVDVTISGPPLELLRVLLIEATDPAGFPEEISISGDIGTAQRVKSALRGLDLDWEEALSRVMGDVAAHQVGRTLRGLDGWGRRSIETLLGDAGEYLTQEVYAVPARSELEAFATAVDLLRDDVERLDRRVQRVSQRKQERNG